MAKSPAGLPQKRSRGRPSKFTEAIAMEICDRLSKGEPLAVICRDEHMPHPSTVRDWQLVENIPVAKEGGSLPPEVLEEIERRKAFSLSIARAREDGHDAIAADVLRIADDDSRDWEPVKDADGNIVGVKVDGEHVQRSKLRIETRLKLLAKWDPKRYGEKVAEITNINAQVETRQLNVSVDMMAPEQRDALRAMLLAAKRQLIEQKPDDAD